MHRNEIDQSILDATVPERSPGAVDVVTSFTHTGGTVAIWIASATIVVALLLRGERRVAGFFGAVMLSGWGLTSVIKVVFARERPPIPLRLVEISSYSFPSGHATMTMMFVCTAGLLLARSHVPTVTRVAALVCLGLYTLAIGLSRIYLAAHWATDVLAGWALGAVWVAVCALVAHRLRLRERL